MAGDGQPVRDDGPTIPEDVANVLADLVDPLTAYLRRRAPRILLEQESAADLAQSVCRETLESVQRGALAYEGDGPLRQWVFGAADHKLSNRVRRVTAAKRGRPEHAEADAFAGEDPTPSADAALREEERLLRETLESLDERSRAAVQAFHFDGCSHAEVAARLGVTESHSRTIVARGLARLTRLVRERVRESSSGEHPEV